MMSKLHIMADLDEVTSSSYWHGHGHSFEENLIGCLPIHVMAAPNMTLDEYISEALSQWDWDIVDEEYAEDVYAIKTKELEAVLLDALALDRINHEDIFDYVFEDKEALDTFNDDMAEWDVYFYGHIHVYREVNNDNE